MNLLTLECLFTVREEAIQFSNVVVFGFGAVDNDFFENELARPWLLLGGCFVCC